MGKGLYTTDFHQEYAAETTRIIRDRFVWLCALVTGFTLLFSLQRVWNDLVIPLLQAVRSVPVIDWHWGRPVGGLPDAITIGVFGLIGWRAWIGRYDDANLMRYARQMLQLCGVAAMLLYPVYTRERVLPIESVFLMHVLACACLPWSLKEAIRPMYPLLVLSAMMILVIVLSDGVSGPKILQAAGLIVFSPLVLAPGAIIATVKDKWRTELFRTRFFETRYGQMRRELIDARALHEALFPKAGSRDGIRLDYRYEPVRQIGGDFIFARWLPDTPEDASDLERAAAISSPAQSLTVVLLDVTGHGLSSALTVNRISGELERLFAEDPATSPSEALRALNRYVYLTLAPHAIYATAMVARVDRVPPGEVAPGDSSFTLRYANAGHPPAFLRRARKGDATAIQSTAPMLGVLPPNEFATDAPEIKLWPGDRFIAYTDGAVETRNVRGELFGVERVRRLLSSPEPHPQREVSAQLGTQEEPDGWPEAVIAAVDTFRSGPPTDDTVVVEIAILESPRRPD